MERQDLSPGELMPAIVQDAGSGRVLMLAWMDEEALRRTRESGEAWFWSRSRQEYWHKGATSGNTLAIVEIRDDCDGDAILLRVDPAGPACHTGAESCFAPWLWRVVAERAATRPRRLVRGRIARRGRRRRRTEGRGGGSRGCPRRRGRLRRAPRRGASGSMVPQLRSACRARARSREGRGGAPPAPPDHRLGDLAPTRGGGMARTPLLNQVEDAMGPSRRRRQESLGARSSSGPRSPAWA